MELIKYLLIFVFLTDINGFINKCNNRFNLHCLLLKKKDDCDKKLYLQYKPKTENQQKYVNTLNSKDDSITIVVGPAGTGKTLMACNIAINYLKEGKIDKIIITRPVVPVEEEIGYLPGSLVKKMDPWTRPIFDIFEEFYKKTEVNNMINNGQIEISPLGFMRGRTFKNAFIIADEMQNSSPNQMYMLLTRIGENSRMAITGDLEQSDRLENNGLKDLIEKYKQKGNMTNINLVELDKKDIQRSKLVNQVINLYSKDIIGNKPNLKKNMDTFVPLQNNTTKNTFTKSGFDDAALIPSKDFYGIK